MGKHRTTEASEALFSEVGMYSAALLNDKKVEGSWIKSIRLGSATYNGRVGRTYFSRSYSVWNGIRARSKEGGAFQKRFPHYVGTTICSEWDKSFEAFADWYTSQVGYEEGWDIDKDALSGSKHYSPETCILLPRVVNLLFSQHHMALNIVPAPLPGNEARCRTTDGLIFDSVETARENAYRLRIDRLNSLREEYVPLGIPFKVFERAKNLISVP